MYSKQNIVMDGLFTKINYLSNWFTMNSIFLNIPIESKKIFTDDRCIIVFDPYAIINLPIIKLFTTIENELLDYYCYSKQKKLKILGLFLKSKESLTPRREAWPAPHGWGLPNDCRAAPRACFL